MKRMLLHAVWVVSGSLLAGGCQTLRPKRTELGFVRCTIHPQAAIDAGAEWKLGRAENWQDSGNAIGAEPGTYRLKFRPRIQGMDRPTDIDLIVTANCWTTVHAEYRPENSPAPPHPPVTVTCETRPKTTARP